MNYDLIISRINKYVKNNGGGDGGRGGGFFGGLSEWRICVIMAKVIKLRRNNARNPHAM